MIRTIRNSFVWNQLRTGLGLLALSAIASGCFGDERDERWERPRSVIGPIPIKSRLAYVDSARDRVVSLETEGGPRVASVAIGRNAVFARPAPDGKSLAVLTVGQEAFFAGEVDEEPLLWMVDLSKPGSQALRYEIGSPFDRVALSSDGSVAVAYFSSGGFDATSGVFRNPNELAIVDLTAEPSEENPVLRTVRSFGSAPDGIVLSPPMAIPGAEDEGARVFAFVLAEGAVTILDATNPLRREVTIRLGEAPSGAGMVRPQEMVFAPNTATAYLRSQHASDVLSILLTPEAPVGDTDNDYQPILAELGAGEGPADVAVYDDDSGRRFVLASMANRRQLAVIDGDTAEFITVDTPDPIDRIMLFPNVEGVAPKIALLASISQGVPRVHLLGLEGISESLVPVNLETVNLTEDVLDVVAVAGSERAMIVHDADRTVLGLLDVRQGSVSPLQGVGRLDTFDFSVDGNYLVGATPSAERVGFLHLGSLHPTDLRIDDAPQSVHALDNGAVIINHDDPFGRATYVPGPDARRSDAAVFSGFLLHDYLDESKSQ